MQEFLCDLMAHAEWANAVFFEPGGIPQPATMRSCAAAWTT